MSEHPISAAAYYRSIYSSRSMEALTAIAQTKRLVERLTADPAFAIQLQNQTLTREQLRTEYGIDIDPQQLRPLWQTTTGEPGAAAGAWPMVDAYRQFQHELHIYRLLVRAQGDTPMTCPRLHAWRTRQMARCASEFPQTADAITYPIIAFELSQGCTLGCWFCGVSAERFAGHFPYTVENAALWRGVVEVTHDLFGDASHTGFCYWATDPCDNPDYPSFIADYHAITGHLPQTTTAAPFKHPALTQEILGLYATHRCAPCRFSVLSLRVLQQLHQHYRALDLLGVELIFQNKESSTVMAAAGRALERQHQQRESDRPAPLAKLTEAHATIACVTGFLVNMVTRSVQLITPIRATPLAPKGYRVLDERSFVCAASFRDALQEMIVRHMPEAPPAQSTLAFRTDLTFAPLPGPERNGFYLRNASTEHKIMGLPCMHELGQMIASGLYTAAQVGEHLQATRSASWPINAILQHLFDSGFLAENSTAERPEQVAQADAGESRGP